MVPSNNVRQLWPDIDPMGLGCTSRGSRHLTGFKWNSSITPRNNAGSSSAYSSVDSSCCTLPPKSVNDHSGSNVIIFVKRTDSDGLVAKHIIAGGKSIGSNEMLKGIDRTTENKIPTTTLRVSTENSITTNARGNEVYERSKKKR